jgi:hypothetical protein
MRSHGLTIRAQPRRAKRREPRSGTTNAPRRWLQRFVRRHNLHVTQDNPRPNALNSLRRLGPAAAKKVNHECTLMDTNKNASVCSVLSCEQKETEETEKERLARRRALELAKLCGRNSCRDARCRLTTQAQRPGLRDAWIATTALTPGSLQRMVRPRCHGGPNVSMTP